LAPHLDIVRVGRDRENKYVDWLLEARRAFSGYISSELSIEVRLVDADGAVIYKRGIDFSGDRVFKGERIHATWTLPEEAILKRTKKVVVEKR
jgi:hypothetical protein